MLTIFILKAAEAWDPVALAPAQHGLAGRPDGLTIGVLLLQGSPLVLRRLGQLPPVAAMAIGHLGFHGGGHAGRP